MKINVLNIALASAIATAIFWIVCSLLFWAMPGAMANISGNMMHMEMGKVGISLNSTAIIWGLVGWSLSVGVFAWILATIYNLLNKN